MTGLAVVAGLALCSLAVAQSAEAASVLSGPIDLGTSATYGALAGSALTNTGPTTVIGDIGVNPGTSITGFGGAPNGSNTGAVNDNNAAALQAKSDLTTAYNTAAGLTPQSSGLGELNGMSLTPGVYSGGALKLANNGTLTLAGSSANSVWVFQAASSLTIGSATKIVITGGASVCNVFWQVGSSADIGTSAQFQGTVLASKSITLQTGATVAGRLLARTAAVTLESNAITVPADCPVGVASGNDNSPSITSGSPKPASVGTPYSFTVKASGTPAPTFSVPKGSLPSGLHLNSKTGAITGTPTTSGSFTFTITASNGTGGTVSAKYTLVVAAAGAASGTASAGLAFTGVNIWPPLGVASGFLLVGGVLMAFRRGHGVHRGSASN